MSVKVYGAALLMTAWEGHVMPESAGHVMPESAAETAVLACVNSDASLG